MMLSFDNFPLIEAASVVLAATLLSLVAFTDGLLSRMVVSPLPAKKMAAAFIDIVRWALPCR